MMTTQSEPTRQRLTMVLVKPTKANTNVMYAFAAVMPPPGLKVSTDWPPPKIPARSRPYHRSQQTALLLRIRKNKRWTRSMRVTPEQRRQQARYVRGMTTDTHIRSYAGVIILRGLLFFYSEDAIVLCTHHGCPVLQIVGRLIVEGVGISLLGDHLNVHARLRVLNDGA
jgi:hypothetical protein